MCYVFLLFTCLVSRSSCYVVWIIVFVFITAPTYFYRYILLDLVLVDGHNQWMRNGIVRPHHDCCWVPSDNFVCVRELNASRLVQSFLELFRPKPLTFSRGPIYFPPSGQYVSHLGRCALTNILLTELWIDIFLLSDYNFAFWVEFRSINFMNFVADNFVRLL